MHKTPLCRQESTVCARWRGEPSGADVRTLASTVLNDIYIVLTVSFERARLRWASSGEAGKPGELFYDVYTSLEQYFEYGGRDRPCCGAVLTSEA